MRAESESPVDATWSILVCLLCLIYTFAAEQVSCSLRPLSPLPPPPPSILSVCGASHSLILRRLTEHTSSRVDYSLQYSTGVFFVFLLERLSSAVSNRIPLCLYSHVEVEVEVER